MRRMYLMTGEGRSVQCSKLSSATSIMASPFYKKRGMMVAATVTSGYLVKRTQTLRRWKKRWWQLTDDGVLRYFKSEKREKLLGEIDIARSCYDVRLGADHCNIAFPIVVPAWCCFSISVLKRTYYMYAETAADAKNWTENIRMLSLVLNYKKAIRRQAPGAPRPLNHPLGGDTNAAKVMSPSTSEEERQHNTMQRRPREKESEADQSRRITCNVGAESPTSVPELHPNSHTLGRLKSRLDESSATDFHDRLKQKPQRRSQNYPTKQVDLIKGSGKSRQRESLETSDDEIQPNAQAINTQTWPGKRVRLPHRSQARHVDIPILPFLIHNNDVSDDFAKQKQFTPPPIANPHPKRYSYTETDHGREITLKIQSSSESQTSAQDSDCPPDIPPKRCILKVSLDSKNGPQTHFLPPLPDFVPPPPPNKQSGSSSPATNNESVLISSKQISQQDPIEGMTNQCSWEHIHKMSKEIKRLGVCQQDNSVCISFGELLEKTKGIIADLPGTLVAAKRNQVINYDGDDLKTGRDDKVVITLF